MLNEEEKFRPIGPPFWIPVPTYVDLDCKEEVGLMKLSTILTILMISEILKGWYQSAQLNYNTY